MKKSIFACKVLPVISSLPFPKSPRAKEYDALIAANGSANSKSSPGT